MRPATDLHMRATYPLGAGNLLWIVCKSPQRACFLFVPRCKYDKGGP